MTGNKEIIENPIYWATKERDKFWMKRVKKLKEELCLRFPLYQDAIETITDKIMGSFEETKK